MSKALFGQSYYLRFDPKLWRTMQPYPPLGSLYAASYVRAQGHEVALFDAMLAAAEDEWADAIDTHRPRYAVLFEDNFNYLTKMCLTRMRQAAYDMIAVARERGCTVIVNSSDASDHISEYLSRGADYILIGEGEVTLAELILALEGRNESPPSGIPGLTYRDNNGTIHRTAARGFIRDLDQLPFPAWDLIDTQRYRNIWRERHGYYSMNMVTTRGCPYSCNWCAKPIYGQRYNVRSPENVVAELAWLKREFAPDHISFVDDIFGLKPHWIEHFASLTEQRDCAVPFKALLRADLVKDSVVESLQRAKCRTVWMGAESGSQKILDAMDKGTCVEQIYTAAKKLREARIQVGYFIQFGYRGETMKDVNLTRRMVRETLPDEVGISVSYPLPGTKFYEQVRAELGAKQNWTDSDDLAMMYRGTYPTQFYRALYRVVHAELDILRTVSGFKRIALHPTKWRAVHLRKLAAIPLHLVRWILARLQIFLLARQVEETPSAETVAAS